MGDADLPVDPMHIRLHTGEACRERLGQGTPVLVVIVRMGVTECDGVVRPNAPAEEQSEAKSEAFRHGAQSGEIQNSFKPIQGVSPSNPGRTFRRGLR